MGRFLGVWTGVLAVMAVYLVLIVWFGGFIGRRGAVELGWLFGWRVVRIAG